MEDPVTGLAIRLIPGFHRCEHCDAKVERADERRRREAPASVYGRLTDRSYSRGINAGTTVITDIDQRRTD